MEAYVAKMKNEKMLIVDEPQWVIKPQGTFDSRTFPVAVGNRSLKSRVLDDDISKVKLEDILKGMNDESDKIVKTLKNIQDFIEDLR